MYFSQHEVHISLEFFPSDDNNMNIRSISCIETILHKGDKFMATASIHKKPASLQQESGTMYNIFIYYRSVSSFK